MSFSLALSLTGCNEDSTTPISTDLNTTVVINDRFKYSTINEQTVILDVNTSLEWVNGSTVEGVDKGCLILGIGLSESVANATATNHCASLDFAGKTDWRLSTSLEMQEFITGMESEGLIPFYMLEQCARVAGLSATNVLETINTHNTYPIGEINSWASVNSGIRCVRSVTP